MQEGKPMHIALFNPGWSSMGGGEKYLLSIADVLASTGRHRVQLFGDRPGPTLDQCRAYFNLTLPDVELLQCPPSAVRRLIGQAGLAVIESNFRSYGLPAPRTAYILQVPYGPITPLSIAAEAVSGSVKAALKNLLRTRLYNSARRSFLALANSSFSAAALRKHHRIDARVLYPPIDSFEPAAMKRPVILSVGRFFRGMYNDKRYDVLLVAFRRLRKELPAQSPWEYHIAGSCGNDPGARLWLNSLRREAEDLPVHFHPDASYAELSSLYAEASIFWHAAGFGVDEDLHPERTEHFGMSTAESMGAGCIPVVAARGGQKEIVSHGESGYLWNTVDELVSLTLSLCTSTSNLKGMATAARERSTAFSRERFAERCLALFE
jgi:glycosyltransferase involved in cell wall biosynthesis